MHFARIPGIGSFLFRDALCRINADGEKVAYITFDDGPVPEMTPLVLDTLKKYNAKATFFCVGDNVKKYPEIFQSVVEQGHGVGNHTFNHMDGWKNSLEVYMANVDKCSEVVDSKLFRPPYGRLKLSQYKAVKKQFKIVLWDVLSGDYDINLSTEKCLEVVKRNTRPGSILVFHDNAKTKNKLPDLLTGTLDFLRGSGYALKALSPTI